MLDLDSVNASKSPEVDDSVAIDLGSEPFCVVATRLALIFCAFPALARAELSNFAASPLGFSSALQLLASARRHSEAVSLAPRSPSSGIPA